MALKAPTFSAETSRSVISWWVHFQEQNKQMLGEMLCIQVKIWVCKKISSKKPQIVFPWQTLDILVTLFSVFEFAAFWNGSFILPIQPVSRQPKQSLKNSKQLKIKTNSFKLTKFSTTLTNIIFTWKPVHVSDYQLKN